MAEAKGKVKSKKETAAKKQQAAVRRKAQKEFHDRGPWTAAAKAELNSVEMPNRYLLLNGDCDACPPTEAPTINVLVGHLTPEERAVATGARQEQRVYGFYERVLGMPERLPVVVRERMVCTDVGG